MTTPTDFRPYPPVKLKMNRYGHLELWQELEKPYRKADLYIQLESDVQAILECLPADDREDAENGFFVTTYFISDEYFGNGGMTQ